MLTFTVVWFAAWALFFLFKWQAAKGRAREAEAERGNLSDRLRSADKQRDALATENAGLRANARHSAEALSKAFRRLEEAEEARKREAAGHAAELSALRGVVAGQAEALGEGREFMGEWLKRIERTAGA